MQCYITPLLALWVNPSILFVCSLFFPPTPLIVFLVAMKKCAMPLSEPLVDHRPGRPKWFEEVDVSRGRGDIVTLCHLSNIRSFGSSSVLLFFGPFVRDLSLSYLNTDPEYLTKGIACVFIPWLRFLQRWVSRNFLVPLTLFLLLTSFDFCLVAFVLNTLKY